MYSFVHIWDGYSLKSIPLNSKSPLDFMRRVYRLSTEHLDVYKFYGYTIFNRRYKFIVYLNPYDRQYKIVFRADKGEYSSFKTISSDLLVMMPEKYRFVIPMLVSAEEKNSPVVYENESYLVSSWDGYTVSHQYKEAGNIEEFDNDLFRIASKSVKPFSLFGYVLSERRGNYLLARNPFNKKYRVYYYEGGIKKTETSNIGDIPLRFRILPDTSELDDEINIRNLKQLDF